MLAAIAIPATSITTVFRGFMTSPSWTGFRGLDAPRCATRRWPYRDPTDRVTRIGTNLMNRGCVTALRDRRCVCEGPEPEPVRARVTGAAHFWLTETR
jgi:hypothetical protein